MSITTDINPAMVTADNPAEQFRIAANLFSGGATTKVLFLFGATTHYYNEIFNRLNEIEGLEVVVVTPSKSETTGDGVFETLDNIRFRHILCAETRDPKFGLGFANLATLIANEKPNIIVTGAAWLGQLKHDQSVRSVCRRIGTKIILKDHPFRLPTYDAEKQKIDDLQLVRVPRLVNLTKKLHRQFGCRILRCLYSAGFPIALEAIKWRRRRILNRTRKLFNFPDALVCYVDAAFDVFGSYGVDRKKIFIIRNSPDTDLLFSIRKRIEGQTALPYNPHRIIHVGRLVEWKRVDLLLEALRIVRQRHEDAELLVLGVGPKEAAWKQLAQDLGLAEAVHFVGGVYAPEQLGLYLQSCGLYVLAGMGGLSINDAMAFGLPVICSVCDGTERKLVRDGFNGAYFEEGSANDLAIKVLSMFADEGKMVRMGENSSRIIRGEVNIYTVLNGYLEAFACVNSTAVCRDDRRNEGGGRSRNDAQTD